MALSALEVIARDATVVRLRRGCCWQQWLQKSKRNCSEWLMRVRVHYNTRIPIWSWRLPIVGLNDCGYDIRQERCGSREKT